MNMLKEMNNALDYIEENLTEDINLDDIARIACSSTYHFQKMFSYIIGIPISEYIRRRRLTLAALEIQSTNKLITDIALKYGYNSPDSFTRAFTRLHGVTPSNSRKMGTELKAYSKISFQISIKGDIEMNYRIEEKESFKVVGIETVVSAVDGKCYTQIPEFWLECINNGTIEKFKTLMNLDDDTLLNGAIGNQDDEGNFTYMICANALNEDINGFKTLTIPKTTWAIFKTDTHNADESSQKVQNIWKRVFTEWFPTSGYEHAKGTEFEMYYKAENNKFYAEVWIPVLKK